METYKIQTLQKMLEQEKLNLERLKGETNNPSYKLSEANIRKLREQLRQVGAEVSACILLYIVLSSLCSRRSSSCTRSYQCTYLFIYISDAHIYVYVCIIFDVDLRMSTYRLCFFL